MGLFVEHNSVHYKEIIEIGREYLVIVSSFYLLFSTMFVYNGVTRGAGATFIPMLITTLSLWIIRIPIAWILSQHYGSSGIWWSIPIAWSVGLLGAFIYYETGLWKKHAVQMR
jgi:Na+-driven multidrug efflux pump